MTKTTALALALCLVAGCRKNEQAKAPPPSGSAKARPAPLTAEQRKQAAAHLRAGRKHANAKEWGPAVTEFEAALQVGPGDPVTLSELGWAAFSAGDVARAKKVNADALRVAADPKLKAAILYNMGRVAESENDTKTAAADYQQSVALRPSAAVSERLAKLGQAPAPETKRPLPCTEPRKLDDVCACLKAVPSDQVFFEDQSGANNLDCDFEKTAEIAGVRLIHLGADDAEKAFLVVADTGKGWAVIGDVDHDQDLGRTQEKFALASLVEKKVGEGRLLWLEYDHAHSYGGHGGFEEEKTRSVLVCVLAPGAPRCPLDAPLAHSSASGEYDENGNEKKTEDASSHYRVDLGPDGTATVVQVENKGDKDFKAPLGPHKLW
jgi:tetratricopeptide (TPR) repeat protein